MPQQHRDGSPPPVAERPAAPQRNTPQPGGRGKNKKDRTDQKDEPHTFAPASGITHA
jgi:hypothetical protein